MALTIKIRACMAVGVDGGTNWPGVDSIHGID